MCDQSSDAALSKMKMEICIYIFQNTDPDHHHWLFNSHTPLLTSIISFYFSWAQLFSLDTSFSHVLLRCHVFSLLN